jgi:hypothetical protein
VAAAHPDEAAFADVDRREEKITALIQSGPVIPQLLVAKGSSS